MRISIRESKSIDGLARLLVYRPRERTWALPGSAYETKSGYWIVYVPEQAADVVECKADAATTLQNHYAKQEG